MIILTATWAAERHVNNVLNSTSAHLFWLCGRPDCTCNSHIFELSSAKFHLLPFCYVRSMCGTHSS